MADDAKFRICKCELSNFPFVAHVKINIPLIVKCRWIKNKKELFIICIVIWHVRRIVKLHALLIVVLTLLLLERFKLLNKTWYNNLNQSRNNSKEFLSNFQTNLEKNDPIEHSASTYFHHYKKTGHHKKIWRRTVQRWPSFACTEGDQRWFSNVSVLTFSV